MKYRSISKKYHETLSPGYFLKNLARHWVSVMVLYTSSRTRKERVPIATNLLRLSTPLKTQNTRMLSVNCKRMSETVQQTVQQQLYFRNATQLNTRLRMQAYIIIESSVHITIQWYCHYNDENYQIYKLRQIADRVVGVATAGHPCIQTTNTSH